MNLINKHKISIEVGRSVSRSFIARIQPTIIRLTLRRSATSSGQCIMHTLNCQNIIVFFKDYFVLIELIQKIKKRELEEKATAAASQQEEELELEDPES